MRICSHCRKCYGDHVEHCAGPDHSDLSERHSGSPEMIAGYCIETLLESGLKGELYRARQLECGQNCSIRVISPKKKSGYHFLREAKHSAALFHPNLVDVYEAGILETGQFYVVSEEPDGETLREHLITSGVPPLLTTIELMEQTAEALHTLHEEGLLHRALRPENIVLGVDGEGRSTVRLKDIDFGGVIERSIIGNKFVIDTALDAVRYFAPEQFTDGGVSVQSDVYSLGIILYEMLAGAPPFDASKASALVEKHRHQMPKEIHIDNFDLRMLLTHTLNESLQKDRSKRHGSAQAFARQLRHMEQLATHVSTPPPALTVEALQSRPKHLVAIAAASPARPEPGGEPEPQVPSKVESELRAPDPDISVGLCDPWNELEFHVVDEEQIIRPNEQQAPELATGPESVDGPQSEEHLPKARLDRASRHARIRLRRSRSILSEQPMHDEGAPALPETQSPISEMEEQLVSNIRDESLEPPSTPTLYEPDVEEITAVTARKDPVAIDWQMPEDDIPSIEAVFEELAKDDLEPSFTLKEPLKPELELDKRSKRHATDSEDVHFLSTVMRNSREKGSLDLFPSYSILSDYGAAQTRFSFDYQTLVVGVGLIALVALLFFGNIIFRQYTATQSPVAPTPFGSVVSQPQQTQVAETAPAKKTTKVFQKSRTDDLAGGDSSASTTPVSGDRKQPPANERAQNQPTKKTGQTQAEMRPPSVSSTLVISSENGKVRSTVETGSRTADKRPPIATNKVTGTTRPRLVTSPKQ